MESRQRVELDLLVYIVSQHIWTTDPDDYHTYFSRRWCEFTGADLK